MWGLNCDTKLLGLEGPPRTRALRKKEHPGFVMEEEHSRPDVFGAARAAFVPNTKIWGLLQCGAPSPAHLPAALAVGAENPPSQN